MKTYRRRPINKKNHVYSLFVRLIWDNIFKPYHPVLDEIIQILIRYSVPDGGFWICSSGPSGPVLVRFRVPETIVPHPAGSGRWRSETIAEMTVCPPSADLGRRTCIRSKRACSRNLRGGSSAGTLTRSRIGAVITTEFVFV